MTTTGKEAMSMEDGKCQKEGASKRRLPAVVTPPPKAMTNVTAGDSLLRDKTKPAMTISSVAASKETNTLLDNGSTLPEGEFERICSLLPISTSGPQATALAALFAYVGATKLEDVAFIEQIDFQSSEHSITLTAQRKLLRLKEQLLAKTPSFSLDKPDGAAIPDVVDVNVGGARFCTTKATLCSVPGSVLEGMFSGRHKNPARQKDGCYIIDRDGTQFPHILNFLRVGGVISLPSNETDKEALAVEADYYGLEDLVSACRRPPIDAWTCLPEHVKAYRKSEHDLRELFRTKAAHGLDDHSGLSSLFCPDNGITPLPVLFQTDKELIKGSAIYMDNLRKPGEPGQKVTVASLEEFVTNFNQEHANILHRLSDILLEEPVLIAGGSVLRALTRSDDIRTSKWWCPKSDIDIFLHCRDSHEAVRITQRIFYALAVDNERWVIVRSGGVVTMHSWISDGWRNTRGEKVQVILRLYDSAAEVLLGFDCDCCCCGYDGRSVLVTPRWLAALRTGVNIMNPLHAWPNKPSYEFRLAKYAHRGFAVAVPGLANRLMDSMCLRNRELKDLKGLARLLKISSVTEVHSAPESLPESDSLLEGAARNCFSSCEELVNGWGGYEDLPDDVLVPNVYCGGEPGGHFWWNYVGGDPSDFPQASVCKDAAWAEIENAAELNLPCRLVDAWDIKKRSREYLNASMDHDDLVSVYYGHALDESK